MPFKVKVARRLYRLLGLDEDRARSDRRWRRLDAQVTAAGMVGTYQAIALLSDRYRTGTGTDLRLAEHKVFSQNGEDGILCAILTALDITQGRFVEFGVEDGAECCTRFLAEILGWHGRYIEPDPAGHAALAVRWERTDRVETVHAAVTPGNVNELVGDPDLLVIDVDGQDYWLWEAYTGTPAVVVIEFNPEHDEIEPVGTPWSTPTRRSGTGLAPLRKLGETKGYRLVHTDAAAVNAFFVRDDIGFVGTTDRTVNHGLRGTSYHQ